ncbi:MAG: hypothetical protein ACE5IM_11440 [Nitrospinota bacterium]
MVNWWRGVFVAAVAAGGILLLLLGVSDLREILEIAPEVPEMLHRRVGTTSVSLAVGLALIVWTLVAGIAWARARREGERR